MSETLEQWLGREYAYAATAMLRSVSAVDIVKERPGFGQTIRPVAGSIVASPVLASWDPEPDYFFHWFRDSALVIDAVRLLYEADHLGAEALTHFADFVRFSLSLQALDGRALAESHWRLKVLPEFVQYLRGDDLLAVSGDAVYADVRVNPDGTLDISRWTRPQHDGAPLRVLTLLRWLRALRSNEAKPRVAAEVLADAERLLRADLTLTATHWREPSLDIWEEELGHHYYTLRVAAAALRQGAAWLAAHGETGAASLRAEADNISAALDGYWLPGQAYYGSRIMPAGATSTKQLDISVVLAAIHAGEEEGAHTPRDPRMQATLDKLERRFARLYPINRDLPRDRAPALGRYEGDVYFSGGAYYFATLGAAELCFLAAGAHPRGSARQAKWIARGDGFLATVRAFTPGSGDLSEQFDQRTGQQTSAKHLAWSYAALISCVTARRAAL